MAICTYTATLTRPLGVDTTSALAINLSNTSAAVGIADYTDNATVQTGFTALIGTLEGLFGGSFTSYSISATTDATNVTFEIELVVDDTLTIPILIQDTTPEFHGALFESVCFATTRTPTPESTCTFLSSVTRPIVGDTLFYIDIFLSDSDTFLTGDYTDQADLGAAIAAINALTGINDTMLTATEAAGNVTFEISFTINGSLVDSIPIGFYESGSTSIYTFTCVLNTTANRCPTCFSKVFETCTDAIEFDLGFTASTSYVIRAKDSLQNVYKQTAVSDADGILSYDLTSPTLPSGLFNPHGGIYEFTFRLTSAPNTDVSFIVGDFEYVCVNATFEDVTDTTPA